MSENSHGRVADATGLLPSGSNPLVSSLTACDPSRGPVPGDLNYRSEWEASRKISHEEAREIARRLIASHFRRTDCETARVGIPARPDYDDDLLICSYIKQQSRKDATASSKWQPIATAPKGRNPEGRMQYVLLIGPYPHGTGHWSDIRQCWWDEFSDRWERWVHPFQPTHWMLSPVPPQGIEARSTETSGSARKGESPVAEGHAPDPKAKSQSEESAA